MSCLIDIVTGADLVYLPPSCLIDIVTCADSVFLPPSLEPRVQIWSFCPRRAWLTLSRVQILGFCPRRWNHVRESGLFVPVVSDCHCHGCRL